MEIIMCVWLVLALGKRLPVISKLGEMGNGEPVLAVLRVYIFLRHSHNPKSTNTILGCPFYICETISLGCSILIIAQGVWVFISLAVKGQAGTRGNR